MRNRSSNASHRPSGEGTICVALSLRTCSISSRPGKGDRRGRHADAQQRVLLVAHFANVDARAGVVELRIETALAREQRRTASRRHHVDARLPGVVSPANRIAAGVAVDDRRAVGRERRLHIVTRLRDDVATAGTVGPNHANAAEIGVVPRRVDDPLTVARERWEELVGVLAAGRRRSQALRLTGGQRTDIEVSEGAVDDESAIGRHANVAQHPDREVRRVHGARHPHARVERLLDAGLERDRLPLSAGDVDAPELPLAPDHDRLAVGRPGVLRVETVNGPGFLQVLVDVAKDLTIAAGLEIADEEKALEAHPAHVGERLAVGRDLRRHRAALDADGAALAPGREVAPEDRVDRPVGILVVLERLTGRDVLAVVERGAVGRDVGLARILLPAVAFGDLQSVTWSGRVIHPDLAGAERALLDEVPPGIDVGAIRRPRGTVHEPAPLARDLARVLAVEIDGPDVPQAIAVAGDRNALAVGTEARLHVEDRTARQAPRRRRAAGDRHEIDVSEQVEHHLRSVGAHVEVHPRALAGVKGQRRRRAGRGGDIPLLCLLLGFLLGLLRRSSGHAAPSPGGGDAAPDNGERDQIPAGHVECSPWSHMLLRSGRIYCAHDRHR